MSEPLNPNTRKPVPYVDHINEGGDVPNDHPTAMMYSNGGILLLGLAALFFCLQALEGLFVLSMVLILLLALFNLWTLSRWRKWWPRDPAPSPNPGLTGASGSSTSA